MLELDRLRAMMREAGIEETVDRLIDLFVEDAPLRMAALERATAELAASDMRSTAHAFRSSALGIHAPALATILQRVESLSHEGRAQDAALLVPQVQEQHVAVAELLAAVVQQRDC